MFEPLFEPAPERAELLFADHTAEPPIEVYQQGDIRWLGFGGRAAQSAMSLARSDALVLPYSRAMLLSLLFVPRPRRVLNLGLGGGSIHRFFAAHLPEVSIASVERDPRILEVARRWFALEALTCHVDSAGNWLAQMQQRQDIMICDIQSDGDGLPDEFHDPEFWRHCHSGLTADGVMAINTLSHTETDLVHLLSAAWEVFSTLALVEVPDHRNVVVLASCVAAPPQSLLVERAGALHDHWGIDLSAFIETLRILDREG